MDTEELFLALADGLRDAHLRVESLTVPEDEKASARRQLLAVTDLSKRDLERAYQRLQAFLTDLAQRHPQG